MLPLRRLASFAIAIALNAAPSMAQDATSPTLPGGASAANEVHGDWTVSCTANAAATACSLAQVHANKQTGQRLFGVELLAKSSNTLTGAFMLPFGLRVSAPVRITVDDAPLGGDRPFSTCNQYGCFVPAELGEAEVVALRAGGTLTLTARDNFSGHAVTYAFSLKGLSSAVDRVIELGK